MNEADAWTPHLRADERVLWQAPVAEDRYLAELSRQRRLGLGIGLIALVATGLFGARGLDLIHPQPQPAASDAHTMSVNLAPLDLSAVFLLPIYCAAVLACLVIAIAQVSRFNLRRPAAVRYAVTSARLLAVDATGALVDQLESGDIAAAALGGPDDARSLNVRRKPGPNDRKPFVMLYAEGLVEAKAAIEETLLQPQG
jgi:hypothetical protein